MKQLFTTLCLLIAAVGFAQDFKPGKVNLNEVREAEHPVDPAATAAILNKTGKTYFDFDDNGNWIVVTDVTVRVKIYKKEGLAHAYAEVPFNEKEDVTFYDVAFYTLEGGKVKKTDVKEDKLVAQQGGDSFRKLAFPNAQEGSVVEYRYIHKSPEILSLPDWYFQYEIPVNNIEYSVEIPVYFVYSRLLSPFVPVKETQDTNEKTRYFQNPNFTGEVTKISPSLHTENGNVTFPVAVKTYTAQNVPALAEVNYVDNLKNYRSFVKHQLASLQYPGSAKKIYATDWETVVKSIYYEDGFGTALKAEEYFKKDILSLMEKYTDRDELLNKIFDHVKNTMAWDGEYGYAASKNIGTAYAHKRGNVAEINLMLTAMLRYAGYKVNPVLVSTRDNGHVTFTSSNEYNYVIAGLETANGIVFLDATSKNAVPGILPLRAINGNGRIVRDNLTTDEISLIPLSASKVTSAIVANVGADGVVKGHVKNYYFGQSAFEVREKVSISKNNYEQTLCNSLDKSAISGFSLAVTDFTKPVSEDFSFTNSHLAEVKGDRIYISPMLMYTMAENPFREAKRTCPIDFIYPLQKKYTFSITIPEGYTVESMPEQAYYQVKDGVGGFKFSILNQQNQVQIVVYNDINYGIVRADYQPALKEFYNSIIKKQSEKIVLKKM